MDLNFKRLTLEDQKLFNTFFERFQPTISEYTFSNLFVWQKSRTIEYTIYNDVLIILAHHKNQSYFMPPLGNFDIAKLYKELLDYAQKKGLPTIFKRVPEEHAKIITDQKIKVIEDPDNSDYIYSTESLAFLKGRKYSNKRAWVKKFESEYYHRYMQYTDECKESCIKLLKNWTEAREDNGYEIKDEYDAIISLLENYNYFKIPGATICIDCDGKKEIVAFTFGEKLNNETFVIHFEKADSKFIGAYQAINKYFAEKEIFGNFKYINREQDLGIEGLKKAKKSYYPIRIAPKFIVTV